MNDGFKMVAGEGARLKREQLAREIGRLKDPTERANLDHTFSKLFMFLEEDIERASGSRQQSVPRERVSKWQQRLTMETLILAVGAFGSFLLFPLFFAWAGGGFDRQDQSASAK